MLSANQISVFFNCQHLINGLTFDSDFLHVDSHEWTLQGSLIGLLKKILFWDKWAILGLKAKHSNNLAFTERILLKFCIMKKTISYMETVLMVFLKILLFGVNGPFLVKKWCTLITLYLLWRFFWNFAQWKGPRITWRLY